MDIFSSCRKEEDRLSSKEVFIGHIIPTLTVFQPSTFESSDFAAADIHETAGVETWRDMLLKFEAMTCIPPPNKYKLLESQRFSLAQGNLVKFTVPSATVSKLSPYKAI